MDAIITSKLNHTFFNKYLVFAPPENKYIFRILAKFMIINVIGMPTKKKMDAYVCLFINSCRFDINVEWGIKKLFIKSAASIYKGILSHHELKTDFSFACTIAVVNIASCFK